MPANDLILNELLSHHNNVRIYGQIVRVSSRPLSISKGSDPFDKNKSPAGRPAGHTRMSRKRYMGGMGGAAGALSSSGFSTTIASVVSSREATLAAFWSAERTTLAGSTIPAFTMSSNLPLSTL